MVNDTWLLMQLYWKLDRREVAGQSILRILAFILGGIGILFIGGMSAALGYGASFLTDPELPVVGRGRGGSPRAAGTHGSRPEPTPAPWIKLLTGQRSVNSVEDSIELIS